VKTREKSTKKQNDIFICNYLCIIIDLKVQKINRAFIGRNNIPI